MMKILKYLLLLAIVLFAIYLNHLDEIVKQEFSTPLDSNNSNLTLEQHPKALINMLLLVEDQSFFEHSGVDFVEIGRVIRDYFLKDKPIRGASTLTQQMIKNALLTKEQTFGRKLKEALMALLLDYSFDKKFILNRYMNSVYLGQTGRYEVLGFQRAAKFYFNKNLNQLSLNGLATLVALTKGPSYYHPVRHPERILKRRNLVLRLYYKYQKIVK
ncbi:Multimodular transpeptidase-transglycosylase [uncultured Candidatus Thioglobus sp.]|nr:Multimodular transpeptidase-transglycosylase [uncultured Candidatus Thioglobus sp.]